MNVAKFALIIGLLAIQVPVAQAIYIEPPSNYDYGGTRRIFDDYNSRVNSILRDSQRSSDLNNLRWDLDRTNNSLQDINNSLNSIRNQQSLNAISRNLAAQRQLRRTMLDYYIYSELQNRNQAAAQATATPKCAVHSTPSQDGKSCICDTNYEPDPTAKYCVFIRDPKRRVKR